VKMTSDDALKLLDKIEKEIGSNHWINHSRCVGNAAGIIAGKLSLDVDKARVLGYIHDIGKYIDGHKNHVMKGYNYIKELGYDDEYANICLTHPYLNNDVNCTAGGIPRGILFRTEFIKKHEYTIYEKIINLCDLMCTDVIMSVDKRLIDIMIRIGTFENTQYHIQETYKLKEYIDQLLGFNVYDLFPDISNNL